MTYWLLDWLLDAESVMAGVIEGGKMRNQKYLLTAALLIVQPWSWRIRLFGRIIIINPRRNDKRLRHRQRFGLVSGSGSGTVQALRAAQEVVPLVTVLPAKAARPKQKPVVVAVRELADLEGVAVVVEISQLQL
jgi:hypothetical protein